MENPLLIFARIAKFITRFHTKLYLVRFSIPHRTRYLHKFAANLSNAHIIVDMSDCT